MIPLKGNRNFGNKIVGIREILLDLRLKVNYIESQAIYKKQSRLATFFYAIMKSVMIMNDKRFEVINGVNDNSDLTKPIEWVRADQGQQVMSLHPTALTATMSKRRLCNIAENAKEHPEIEVTYSKFDEEDKRRKKEMDALKEMFEGDEKIIVFDPHNKHI